MSAFECRIPVGFMNPDSRRPMATSEPPQTGYDDTLFVNPPSPSLGLHCPICYLILKEPHLLSCCGKHMCQSCLQRVTAMGPQTCPCCRSEGFQAMLNKEKQTTIKGLTVRCMNETKGCDWTGELGYSQEHLEKRCQFVEIPCQYGCGKRCLRSSIINHEKDQCINRPMEVKLESFMRQVTEKMAAQEKKMAAQEKKMVAQEKEMAELKEQLKKHELKAKTLESDAQKMKQQIKNLESIAADGMETVSINKGVWRLFHSSMEGKWKGLEREMKEKGIQVVSSSKPMALKPFVKIKGERECVAQMKAKLIQLQNSVSEKRVMIAYPVMVQYFSRDSNGQVLLKGLETEAKVCIESDIENNDSMCIYGETNQLVQRAEKRLLSIIATIFINEEIDDHNISELPPTHLNQLEEFAHECSVDIEIEIDPAIHSIKLHGCQKDVLLVKDKVRDVLTQASTFKQKKKVAKTISKHVKWIRQLSNNQEDYDEFLNLDIEEAYQQDKMGTYKYNGDYENFTIDFPSMEETDLDTKEKVKVIRVDFAEVKKPRNWVPMPKDSNNREVTVHLVPLQPTDPEYKDALAKFDATMKFRYSKLVSIQRIQNPVLYGQYVARKKEMEKRNPPQTQNERLLFYGTKHEIVDNICTEGFYRSRIITACGQGVHFSRDASHSHHYYTQPGQRSMFLATVLTGEFVRGTKSMLVPPEKPGQRNILYDSTVDNVGNPSVFVVYTDAQAYAAYLIKYLL